MTATVEPEVGVRYSARRNTDGTWNVYDVPIMGPVPEGVRKAPEDIGADWMHAAVKTAKLRESEGYYAPLHLEHHDEGVKPLPSGFIRLMRVGETTYEGQTVPCIFGDFVRVPARFMDRIAAGELPFRSVEIFDWKKPEINSLALLDSDVPFFRFPAMVGVRVEGQAGDALAPFTPLDSGTPTPMAAFRASEKGAAILFEFDPKKKDEEAPADEGKPAAEPNTGTPFEGAKEGDETGDKTAAPGADGEPGVEGEDAADGDAPTDEAPDDDVEVKAADDMAAGLMGKLDEVMSALSKLCAVLLPTEEAVPPAKPKTGLEPEDLNASGDVSAMSADAKETVKMTDKPKTTDDGDEIAKLRAKVAALESRDADRATREAASVRLKAAETKLKGFNLTEKMRAELNAAALVSDARMDAVVAMFSEVLVADPAPSLEAIEAASAKPTDAPEIAAFAAKLPEEKRGAYFKAAREVAADYDRLGAKARRLMTREKFIASHPTLSEFAV